MLIKKKYIMIRSILLVFFVGILGYTSRGQSQNQKTLQNAVQKYNSYRDEVYALSNPVTDDQITVLENKAEIILLKLDSIKSPDDDEMRRVISYFRLNTNYLIGYTLGIAGYFKKCYSELQVLENEFFSYSPLSFPMRYSFFGKNYIIKYDNFLNTLHNYYSSMTELSFRQSNYSETLRYGRKSEALNTDNSYMRLITQNYMLQAKNKQNIKDKEVAELSVLLLESHSKLSEENLKLIADNKLDVEKVGWENLRTMLNDNTIQFDKIAFAQRAASALSESKKSGSASEAYAFALSMGSINRDFLIEAAEFGIDNDKALGIRATDKLMQISSESNCEIWSTIGILYTRLGESKKSSQAYNQGDRCHKKMQKTANRNSQNFHIYLATYPARYFTKPEKMDYSGVIGILSGKTMLNFSFIQVKQKNYYFSDLWLREKESTDDNWKPKWDGIQADFGIRFCQDRFSRTGSYTYVGPKFGYARKTLSSVESGVTDASGNYSVQVFNPVDEQLQLMIESGVIAYSKSFGIDLNFGVGAYYGTFSSGNDQYKIEEATFDNILLNNETQKHWAPILRINITLGLML